MSDELRRLLTEATPGPWTKTTFGNASTARAAGVMASYAYATSRAAGVPMTDLTVIDGPTKLRAVGFTGNGPHSPENAALIVAAVNALPALLDVVEAAAEWAADDDAGCECSLCMALRRLAGAS